MIGDTWSPYPDRVIPGSDYRGEKINAAVENLGAYAAVRVPHFVRLDAPGASPVVLERYSGLTGPLSSEVLSVALGGLYGTADGSFLIDNGFAWFFDPLTTWNGARALPLWRQIFPVPAAGAARWWLAAGVAHVAAYDGEGEPADITWPEGFVEPNWRLTWSVWFADDIPSGDGGIPSSTLAPGFSGYSIGIGATAVFDPDVPVGSRFRTKASFDPMRQISFTSVFDGQSIRCAPWFPRMDLT